MLCSPQKVRGRLRQEVLAVPRIPILVVSLAVTVVSLPVAFALAAGPSVTPTPPSSVTIAPAQGVTPPNLSNTPPPIPPPVLPGSSVSIVRPGVTPPPLRNTYPPAVSLQPPVVNPHPVVPVPPPSVPLVIPVVTPPAPLGQGLGTPNDFASLANTGNTSFQPGVFNPFNNPHPMLPWGDGQIGGERYGQVLRYWENQPQTVYNVRFEQQAAPPQELSSEPPATQPGTPTQGALDARAGSEPEPQSVVVPAYWIIETTRGYIHMPRWVLQEIGGGRYRWALVTGWFQPR
jgi:hypothetical protein